MRHLSPDVLLDVAEGQSSESARAHLAACDACRQQVSDLQGTLRALTEVDVPEPSPLFWDHFSARVREAVADDARPAAGWLRPRFSWRLAVGASAALILLARLAVKAPSVPPGLVATPATVAGVAGSGAEAVVATAEDPSLGLLVDLAGDLDWEGAVEAGLDAPSGAADAVAADLTDEERVEMRRILQAEMVGT